MSRYSVQPPTIPGNSGDLVLATGDEAGHGQTALRDRHHLAGGEELLRAEHHGVHLREGSLLVTLELANGVLGLDILGAQVHENLGEVNLHGANLEARTAERGCVGQRVVVRSLDTGELRGQNRADGARVGGAVGVTAGALVHGAHVHAGGATDATQSLAANLVGQNGGTTVVDEDDVHVLRAVTGGDAGPHGGGVGVHALTGGGTGQQLQEGLVVLEGGQNLLDTHEGNQGVGQG